MDRRGERLRRDETRRQRRRLLRRRRQNDRVARREIDAVVDEVERRDAPVGEGEPDQLALEARRRAAPRQGLERRLDQAARQAARRREQRRAAPARGGERRAGEPRRSAIEVGVERGERNGRQTRSAAVPKRGA